ncbi:MAG: Rpn family recombination-promoting nuclease/putative transposase [Clostridiales bacterium]|nr:Rpn family recombination-promoting nuclease/putative transposase [Clostridiales bacterium]
MKIHKKTNERSDITYDYIFKSIFGSEENKYFTKRLIELITGIKVEKIEVYQDATLEQYRRNEKTGRLDVKAIINDGIIINIEMQNYNEGDIEYRTERYGTKIYANSINKGTQYKGAKEVILINILNFRINKHKEYLSKTVTVIEKHRETEIKTKLKYYFIELPKVEGQKLNREDKLTQWLIYMRGKEKEEIEMIKEKNRDIRKLDKAIERVKKREERRENKNGRIKI